MEDKLNRRQLIKAAVVTGLAVNQSRNLLLANGKPLSVEEKTNENELPWYRQLIVGVEYGPTGANPDPVYMSRASGKDIIDNLRKANGKYMVLFSKDMEFAYYNSKVAPRCPGLKGRDLLRETLDEANKYDIPVIAYCQIQNDSSTWRKHPDWRMKKPDGSDLGNSTLCFNSDYINFIKNVAAEMMEYEIKGFHFDMLQFNFRIPTGCWCDICKTAFKKEYGIDMPKGITWDKAWDKMIQFQCDSNSRFCQDLQAFVKSQRTDVAVDFNYHGYPPFTFSAGQKPVQHALNGDFVTCEGTPWIFGHNTPSMISLFIRGARLEGPWQVATSTAVFNYHDFTTYPTAELKWEVMTYMAHGLQCTYVDKAYYEGHQNLITAERTGEVFAEVKEKRELFGHKPLQEVGIYYSVRSRNWYGREDEEKYMKSFWGAHVALLQAHITMGVIMDDNVSLERLKEFPVVYLPNTTILTDKEVTLFMKYVAQGGNLLVTGLTGLYDYYGRFTDSSALEEMTGAKLTDLNVKYPDNYLKLPKELTTGKFSILAEDVPTDWSILTYGPLAALEPTTAEAIGELWIAHRTQNNHWTSHMSPGKMVGPAILINNYGEGKVITVPCSIDAAFVSKYHMIEHRNLIRNMVRLLNPKPLVTLKAPSNVEMVVTQDKKGRTLIHLICFSAPATFAAAAFPKGKQVWHPQMEESMNYKATIDIGISFTKAKAFGKNTKISTTGKQIQMETNNIHEVIMLE